jgi:hypothetical protein
MLTVDDSAVTLGWDHMETLAALHFQKPPEEQMEAITLVMESFGMDESAKEALLARMDGFVPASHKWARGWLIMGFLAGLSAAQNAESE